MPNLTFHSDFKQHVMLGGYNNSKPSGLHSLNQWTKGTDIMGAERWIYDEGGDHERKIYVRTLRRADDRVPAIRCIIFSAAFPDNEGALNPGKYKASTLWPPWMDYDAIRAASEEAYADYEAHKKRSIIHNELKDAYSLPWVGYATIKRAADSQLTTKIWLGAQKATGSDSVISTFPAVNNMFL